MCDQSNPVTIASPMSLSSLFLPCLVLHPPSSSSLIFDVSSIIDVETHTTNRKMTEMERDREEEKDGEKQATSETDRDEEREIEK